MPSQLVDDVRAILRERPLTMPERALLLASLLPPRRGAGEDVVDELEAAIVEARHTVLVANADPAQVRASVKRLLAACRAVLDHTPDHGSPLPALPPLPEHVRPKHRADVDG